MKKIAPAPTKANKMLFYNSIASNFDSVVNMYDTNKRVDVVFNELMPKNIKGKNLLDAGCGTGWFSVVAKKRGAVVTALDIGKDLLKQVSKKVKVKTVEGSVLKLPFKKNTFDIVMSNEVIEHVTEPKQAIAEMSRVLKPGGILILTTPNKFWHWAITLSNKLNLRPYQGLENWSSWNDLSTYCNQYNLTIEKRRGIHLFPFIFSFTHSILDALDIFHPITKSIMVNMAIAAKKKSK